MTKKTMLDFEDLIFDVYFAINGVSIHDLSLIHI